MGSKNSKCSVVVLISGRGSNLAALCNAAEFYEICGVVSNNPEAPGLALTRCSGIPTFAVARQECSSLAQQKERVFQHVRSLQPDFIALAGYMQIVPPEIINEFRAQMLNVHPSLLPLFAGLHSHERAIEAGVTEHGCSVHLVDQGIDTGLILAQAKVPVQKNDTAQILAERVLLREHAIYPWVLNMLGCGSLALRESKAHFDERARLEASQRDFILP